MDYVARLSSLLQERQLAEREMPDALLEGPGKRTFWNRIRLRFTKSQPESFKERYDRHMRELYYSAPRNEAEQRISEQNRTIREIDADIAAIPQVTITRRDHAPIDLPAIAGRAIVIKGIGREPSPYANLPAFKNEEVIRFRYHPAIADGLAEALGSCRAHPETKLSIEAVGRRFPFRSHATFSEDQNYDYAIRDDADGRHYCLKLVLSTPLYAELLKCLPTPDGSQRFSSFTRHILYAPIDHDDTPREIPYGDPTPNIRCPSVRLTRLLVALMSSEAPDAKLEKVISLTESD